MALRFIFRLMKNKIFIMKWILSIPKQMERILIPLRGLNRLSMLLN